MSTPAEQVKIAPLRKLREASERKDRAPDIIALILNIRWSAQCRLCVFARTTGGKSLRYY